MSQNSAFPVDKMNIDEDTINQDNENSFNNQSTKNNINNIDNVDNNNHNNNINNHNNKINENENNDINPTQKNFDLEEATKRKQLIEAAKEYHSIIKCGCGNWRCMNPYCYSNIENKHKEYSEKEYSMLALKAIRQKALKCPSYATREIIPLSYSNIIDLDDESKLPQNSELYNKKLQIVVDAFLHCEILETSFLTSNVIDENNVSINFEELDKTFDIICSRNSVRETTRDLLFKTLQNTNIKISTLLQLRSLLILLENPLVLSDDITCHDLLKFILFIFDNLSSHQKNILKAWFSKYESNKRLEKLICGLQQYMTIRILESEQTIEEITNNLMHESNFENIDDQDAQYEILEQIQIKQQKHREKVIKDEIQYVVKMLNIFHEANEMISMNSGTMKNNANELKIDEINDNNDESECDDVDIKMEEKFDELNKKPQNILNKHTIHLYFKKNSNSIQPLDENIFHNSGLNETICARDAQRSLLHRCDYEHWKDDDDFSYLKYPFLLEAGSKARYLEYDNISKQHEARDNQIEQLMSVHRALVLLSLGPRLLRHEIDLFVNVRRTHLIEDSLVALATHAEEPESLRRKLRIEFNNEPGIDQGGLLKEYYQLIIKQLFDVNYGMFILNEKTHNYWFNRNSFENENDDYRLLGILLGMAIYNNTIVDCRFPRAMFKKLLGQQVDFQDFRDFDPEMAKGFEKMIELDVEIEDIYCRTFSVKYEYLGEEKEDPLKENGCNIPLTKENREEYIELYINYLLNKSIEKQFNSFYAGFRTVCDSTLFETFSAEELELLMCGNRKFDFEALEASARYEDGYKKDSRAVKQFWEIAHQFGEEDKRKLLAFCTGSDRVPIRGLSEISLTISKSGNDDSKLPTSHTCFNHLLLPDYSSKQIMRQRLIAAIQNSEGFGLL